jgi:hypothetical protein
MAVLKRQNSAVHEMRVKQRGSHVKPEVATVSLARGVFGGDRRARTETEREQLNAGEFPMTLTPSASVHQYHVYPWTRTYNSLYLSLNTFSSRPFYLFSSEYSFMTKYCKFLLFFTTLNRSKIPFSLYEFNYLHRNLTRTVKKDIVRAFWKVETSRQKISVCFSSDEISTLCTSKTNEEFLIWGCPNTIAPWGA